MDKQIDPLKLEVVMRDVQYAFEIENIYRESGLTVHRVSQLVNHPPYLVSIAINRFTGMNFNGFVNDFRIKEINVGLKNGDMNKYTIEGIATNVGFTSLSSFYEAFRKAYNCTPIEYQRDLSSVA